MTDCGGGRSDDEKETETTERHNHESVDMVFHANTEQLLWIEAKPYSFHGNNKCISSIFFSFSFSIFLSYTLVHTMFTFCAQHNTLWQYHYLKLTEINMTLTLHSNDVVSAASFLSARLETEVPRMVQIFHSATDHRLFLDHSSKAIHYLLIIENNLNSINNSVVLFM